jgi:hypothetical protein
MADKDFFEDLLEQFDDPKEEAQETNEEEQRRKNKDAEEARKRREAEVKAEAEAKAKEEAEKQEQAKEPEAKVEQPKTVEPQQEVKQKAEQTNRLGEQLVNFKSMYPEVELSALDKDTNFKKFINGKLLGKQNFIELYEDYIDLTSSISGKSQDDLKKNHTLKANASSGTSKPAGKAEAVAEVYSQEDLDKLIKRIPLMNDSELRKVQAKFDRSVDYYKKNK